MGILYAVLALAARHLEITTGSRRYHSNEYEQKCLGILIPMFNSDAIEQLQDDSIIDDSIIVSALILRVLDEMTGM